MQLAFYGLFEKLVEGPVILMGKDHLFLASFSPWRLSYLSHVSSLGYFPDGLNLWNNNLEASVTEAENSNGNTNDHVLWQLPLISTGLIHKNFVACVPRHLLASHSSLNNTQILCRRHLPPVALR